MRGLLLVCVGCASSDVAIDVRPPAGVEVAKVELFLGRSSCSMDDGSECPGIGPESMDAPLRDEITGKVFIVDHPEPFTADMVDGLARFRIQATDEVMPLIVAVGTGLQGEQNSIAILKNLDLDLGARRINLDLETARLGLTKVATPTEARVQLWPDGSPDRDRDAHACLGIELPGFERMFVVPDDDRDCDGNTEDDECRPLVHDGFQVSAPVEADAASCAFVGRVDNFDTVCRLGGEVCNETSPDTRGCNNERVVCIGSKICELCSDYSANCYEEKVLAHADELSKLTCTILFKTDGGGVSPCVFASEELALLPGGCTGASLTALGSTDPFSPSVTVDTGNGATLTVSPITGDDPASCELGIAYLGGIAQTPGAVPPTDLVVKLSLAPNRDMVLPLRILHELLPQNVTCPTEVTSRCSFESGSLRGDQIDLCF